MSSSHEGRAACIGDRVRYTCTVTRSGVLQWAMESINVISTNPIQFNVFDDMPGVRQSPYTDVVNITLVSTEQNPQYPILGNLTSEITIVFTITTAGKKVYCSNGQRTEDESPFVVISGAGNFIHAFNGYLFLLPYYFVYTAIPSHPLFFPTHSIESYGIAEYSVRVQWQTPSDDGGVGISNYTLTLTSDGGELIRMETTNVTERVLSLNYTTTYSLYVRAHNCVGSSNPSSTLTLSQCQFCTATWAVQATYH